MRPLGFSKRWQKLSNSTFTTFRYPRADKDWEIGEEVQIIVQPRRKGGGEKLGIARIIGKERRELDPFFSGGTIPLLTEEEAVADGFANHRKMTDYMEKQYGLDYISLFNKLTLRWVV